jgi:hypothetical protein
LWLLRLFQRLLQAMGIGRVGLVDLLLGLQAGASGGFTRATGAEVEALGNGASVWWASSE